MINIELIRRKLSKLLTYLDKLEPISKKDFKEYQDNDYLRFSTERLIQLIVECAADINNHVVVKIVRRPAEDYRISFLKAADVGLISRELAEQIKGSAGMSNILVHEYMDVDDQMVFEILPQAIQNYKQYCKEVYVFIEKFEKK